MPADQEQPLEPAEPPRAGGGAGPAEGFAHLPVLVDVVTELFAPVPPGVVVDATVGGGGHARALLQAHEHLRVLGLDQDPAALSAAAVALEPFGARARLVRARFDRLAGVLDEEAWVADEATAERDGGSHGRSAPRENVVGVLFDLGVSSPQFDWPERGFSYRHTGPLDMRMDPSQPGTAADLVNEADVETLARLIAANGDERYARRIAAAVVAARPLHTTTELAEVVRQAIPAPARRRGPHPARRTFQALRIAVNDELGVLERALGLALDVLAPGGRLVAISYHSGEDRLVKSTLRRASGADCRCPPTLPCRCGARDAARFRLLRPGAWRPGPAEVAANPRSSSARLRAAERLGATGPAGPVPSSSQERP